METLALIAAAACAIALAYFVLLLLTCLIAAWCEREVEPADEPAAAQPANPIDAHNWHRLHRYRRHLEHHRKARPRESPSC